MNSNIPKITDRHCAAIAAQFYQSDGKGIVYLQSSRIDYIGIYGIDEFLDIETIEKLEPMINAYDPTIEYILLIKKADSIEHLGIHAL